MTDAPRNRRKRLSGNLGPRDRGRNPIVPVLCVLAVLCALVLLGGGGWYVFTRLETFCDRQCRVQDTDLDVVIVTSGKMVVPEVITHAFALTNGANLAEIDFARIRADLLARIPNIRDLRIERRMPNRVTVNVFEREPVARVAGRAKTDDGSRVVDSEGVVFRFARSISALPIIREAPDVRTKPGERLTGSGAAALHLVEAAAAPELVSLGIQEIDTSKPDHLLLVLGNYARAKIAWERMGEDSAVSRASLAKQLRRLAKALASNLATRSTLWTATDWKDPGRVYANDPARATP